MGPWLQWRSSWRGAVSLITRRLASTRGARVTCDARVTDKTLSDSELNGLTLEPTPFSDSRILVWIFSFMGFMWNISISDLSSMVLIWCKTHHNCNDVMRWKISTFPRTFQIFTIPGCASPCQADDRWRRCGVEIFLISRSAQPQQLPSNKPIERPATFGLLELGSSSCRNSDNEYWYWGGAVDWSCQWEFLI